MLIAVAIIIVIIIAAYLIAPLKGWNGHVEDDGAHVVWSQGKPHRLYSYMAYAAMYWQNIVTSDKNIMY